jgi:hypothetical protein
MSQRQRVTTNLEKEYFTRIYRPSLRENEQHQQQQQQQPHQSANFLTIHPVHSYHSASLSSSNFLYNEIHNRNSIRSESIFIDRSVTENSSIRFIDDSANLSIASNLRRLGFESASVCSIMNLRNNSYMRSQDNECIDTLLIQMEPASTSTVKTPPPAAVAAAPAPESAKDAKKDPAKEPLLQKTTEAGVEEALAETEKLNFFQRICIHSKFGKSVANFRANFWTKIKPIDSQSNFYLAWLGIVTLAYIYNIISISIRYSFKYDVASGEEKDPSLPMFALNYNCVESNYNQTSEWDYFNSTTMQFRSNATLSNCTLHVRASRAFLWMLSDYLCDVLYLIDIFLVQTRIRFLKEGLWQSDIHLTSMNYFKSWKFVVSFCFLFTKTLNTLDTQKC